MTAETAQSVHDVALAQPSGMAAHAYWLLADLVDDPDTEDLERTPARMADALRELTSGRHTDPKTVLGEGFASDADEMVVVQGLSFVSLCEHHVMPFYGTATFGYIPRGRILGLSKFARVLEALSRRLQVQERMTQELAQAVHEGIGALGTGVIVRAHHSCMSFRGIRNGGETRTSAMLGALRDEPAARAEFLALS